MSEIENPYEKLYQKVSDNMKDICCSINELCEQNENLCVPNKELCAPNKESFNPDEDSCCSKKESCEQNKELCEKNYKKCLSYKKLHCSLEIINSIYDENKNNANFKKMEVLESYFNKDNNDRSDFETLKDEDKFLDKCKYYGGILFGWMKVLSMIYFCLFLITVTLTGVAMMFYACLKRQGYLITIMHVLWNIIRFFMFSFFIFGAAYGIFDLILKDSILVIKYLFHGDDNSDIIKALIPN